LYEKESKSRNLEYIPIKFFMSLKKNWIIIKLPAERKPIALLPARG
jgi:hypothetical protein